MAISDECLSEMMDTHEVALYLRVKERKIYDLLKDGRIPCTRVTGKWLFPRALIDNWLQRNTEAAAVTDCSPTAGLPPMVVAGSHDPLLEWCLREMGSMLALLPGTSETGLVQMAARRAAIAGVHLLDPATGEYNVGALRRDLAGANVVLIEWARRQQGLVLAPGNPLGITDLAQLAGRRIAMRPIGSGGRSLFEHLAGKAGLDLASLEIVSAVARGETDVGLAVIEGLADAGVAVEAVARCLKLAFVPLHRDRFDLIIDRQAFFEPPVQALLAFTRLPEFHAKAERLGGYDLSALGTVRWNAP